MIDFKYSKQNSDHIGKENKAISTMVMRAILPIICFFILISIDTHWFLSLLIAVFWFDSSVQRGNVEYLAKALDYMKSDIQMEAVSEEQVGKLVDDKISEHELFKHNL